MNGRKMNVAAVGLSEEKNEQSAPSLEVSVERPKRRRFSAEYKLDILRQVDACSEVGGVGEVLRREGLYSSHLTDWRKERDQGALAAMAKKRGRKPVRDRKDDEIERLRRENERLKERLERAETIISIQKKVSEILGIPLKPDKPDESDS
jgi:transposase-like protein